MRTTAVCKLVLVSFVLLAATAVTATTVVVGTCMPNLQAYSTISQAVSAVPSGSTILVCPGSYPEQVTITQPLTLRGVQSGGAANPTITVPSGGLTKSALFGNVNVYYQLLAQGTGSSPVNISDIAIDGNNNGVPSGTVAGVYYLNASGTANQIAIYNQKGSGDGLAVLIDSTDSTPTSVSVLGSSLHDFDGAGISADGNVIATLKSNAIVVSNSFSGTSVPPGIIFYPTQNGTVADNLVITQAGANTTGVTVQSGATVTNNTVENFVIGIWVLGNSNEVKSNRVLLASSAIVISGSTNDVESNFLTNNQTSQGGDGISLNCTGTDNTIIQNTINDTYWGIVDLHGSNTITPNSFSNVAHTVSGPC